MKLMWLWLGVALAGTGIEVTGFDRLHTDPAQLDLKPSVPRPAEPDQWLVLTNGFTTRATVQIGADRIGEMLPRTQARIGPIPAGTYDVVLVLPGDLERRASIDTTRQIDAD